MTNPDRPVGPLDWQNLKLSIGVQILDADPPAQGVNIAGRMTRKDYSLLLPSGGRRRSAHEETL